MKSLAIALFTTLLLIGCSDSLTGTESVSVPESHPAHVGDFTTHDVAAKAGKAIYRS